MKNKLKLLTAGIFIPLISSLTLSAYVFSEKDRNEYKNGAHAYYNNEYHPFDIKEYNFSKWMENVNDNKNLFDMSIPGTHRSGMDSGQGVKWFFNKGAARTQSLNIKDQLESGIRALDLRLNADMVIKHGEVFSNIGLENVLDRVSEFLTINPSEFVVIKVKEEDININNYSQTDKASENYNRILNLQKFQNFLFNIEGRDLDPYNYNVRNLRGKIVIVNNWHRFINNSRIGGFLYNDYISNDFSVQQRDHVSADEKVTRFISLVDRSNNYWRSNNNDQFLFLNYTSISWKDISNKPDNFAASVNQRINGWLNENENVTKLGIVYMDFPGTSVNQAIFKRNYFISNEELEKGILGRLISKNEISIDELFAADNQLTIRGPLANFKITIKDGQTILKEIIIPENYSENFKVISLEKEFKENQNLTFSFSKTIKENQFYSARNYNEINIDKSVVLSEHTISANDLKEEISLYAKYYPASLAVVSEYLKNAFINKLENLKRPSQENINKYQIIKNGWRNLRTNLENLKNQYIEISTLISNFESDYFKNQQVFDEQTKENVKQMLTNFIALVNTDFNITEINNDINFEKYNTLIINIKNGLDKIREIENLAHNIVTGNELNEFENIFSNFDYGKAYWINILNNINNDFLVLVKEILSKSKSNVEIAEFSNVNEYVNRISKLIQAKEFLRLEIPKIKQKIAEVNIGNKITHYENSLQKNIESLISSQIILDELSNFKIKLDEARDYINNVNQFIENNSNNRNQELKDAYVNAIRQLENKINDNENIIDYNTLLVELENIKDLQNNIVAGNDFVTSRIYIIDSLTELFEGQKNIYKEEIRSLPADSYLEISNVVRNARSLNANVYVSNIKNLTFITEARKQNINEVFETTVDNQVLNVLYKENKKINDFVNELTMLLLSFQDYSDYEGYRLLIETRKEAFVASYTNLDKAIKSQISYEDLKEKADIFNTFSFIKDEELSRKITEAIDDISNDNELLNFAKTQYIYKLKNMISNKTDLVNLIKEYNNFKKTHNISKIVSDYTNLNEIQKENITTKMQSVNSLDELEEIKNSADLLNETMHEALTIKKQNENYQNESWYASNSEDLKSDFSNAYNEYTNQILLVDDSITKVNTLIEEFNSFLNNIKQNYLELVNNSELIKAKERFNNALEILNDKINKLNIDYLDKQKDIKLWRTEINILSDKLSFAFEIELVDKYIDDLNEITNNFESKKQWLENKINALNNEYVRKVEIVKNNISEYLKKFIDNLKYIEFIRSEFNNLLSIEIQINNMILLDNLIDKLNTLIINIDEETDQRNSFESKLKQIYFKIEDFDKSPSNISEKDLVLKNDFESINVNIVKRKNDDLAGKIELNYEVSNDKYKKIKHQIIAGLSVNSVESNLENDQDKSKNTGPSQSLIYGLIALFSIIAVALCVSIPLIIKKIKKIKVSNNL